MIDMVACVYLQSYYLNIKLEIQVFMWLRNIAASFESACYFPQISIPAGLSNALEHFLCLLKVLFKWVKSHRS